MEGDTESHPPPATRRARLGRAVRQRRRKAAEVRRHAQEALQQFLRVESGPVSTLLPRAACEEAETRQAGSVKDHDRARARPAVAVLRQQQSSHHAAGGWDAQVELLVASQLGYVPGNAVRVSCFQSQLEYLSRPAPERQKRVVDVGGGVGGGGNGPGSDDNRSPETMDALVAIELYPLAIRGDTTTRTTKASRSNRHGKLRRRKLHIQTSEPTSSEPTDAFLGPVSGAEHVGGSISCCNPNNETSNGDSEVLEPFPTLYWVTHPLLRVLISQLEVEGWVRRFEERLHQDPEAQESMRRAHAAYGARRASLLSPDDQQLLRQRNWESALCPENRGVAGIRFSGSDPASGVPRCCSVKCLHAHAAHYLSAIGTNDGEGGDCDAPTGASIAMDNGGNDNVVGKWVVELIQSRLRAEGLRAEVPGSDEATGRP